MTEALASMARTESCGSAEEALEALRRESADLVLADLVLGGPSGLELLSRVRREQPGTDFVLITGNPSVESAVDALRMGASDYLRKPVDPEELRLVVERVLSSRRIVSENLRLRDELATIEACRALTPCLEPGEVYAVSLDLLLRTLSRYRGLALFKRLPFAGSDGAVFRGFAESETGRLRELLAQDKPFDLEAPSPVGIIASGPLHEALLEAQVRSGPVLSVSLRGRDGEAGVVFVLEDDRPFDDAELARVRIVAGHAELALANAERYVRAKERAFIDDCTEVYNARYLLTALDHEVRRAERYGLPLSVLFIDLDRFKLVNDRHGHLVGSRALRQLSQVILQCVRQVDTLARYGGDEFTVVLVDTGFDVAQKVAERIRRAVEDTPFDAGRGGSLRLTCSVGVATYPEHGRTREQLLDLSDKAMYRAKSNGRNRVCTADEL
jgi:diguanylate cyclase (GGDEF)-like protein